MDTSKLNLLGGKYSHYLLVLSIILKPTFLCSPCLPRDLLKSHAFAVGSIPSMHTYEYTYIKQSYFIHNTSYMLIGGLQKTSLIDYPNHLSAVIFTMGGNWRCPFCHNPELVNQ